MGAIRILRGCAAYLAFAALGTGCASDPPIATEDPVAALELVEMQLEKGENEAALELIEALDDSALIGKDVERYKLLLATATFRSGSPWSAYKIIRKFQDVHRFSVYALQVENLHFDIGEALIKSDASYWVFGADRDDGELVLTEFITRYGTNARVPDALKLVGELSFSEQRYYLARERYKRIVSEFPSSEWAALARFRIAISSYLALVGPLYDFREMILSRNELRDYLASAPERPEFRKQAQDAMAKVQTWLAERYAKNAQFYRRIGNRPGELYNLQRLVSGYPNHPLTATARERILVLQSPDGKPAKGPDR